MRHKPLSDRQRLEHILEAIELAQTNYTIIDEATVDAGDLRYFGFIKLLEIIGEAAHKLSPAIRPQHPAIAWQKITGMRHVLVHDYDTINENLVWHVLRVELPILKTQVQQILATMPLA